MRVGLESVGKGSEKNFELLEFPWRHPAAEVALDSLNRLVGVFVDCEAALRQPDKLRTAVAWIRHAFEKPLSLQLVDDLDECLLTHLAAIRKDGQASPRRRMIDVLEDHEVRRAEHGKASAEMGRDQPRDMVVGDPQERTDGPGAFMLMRC